MRANSLTNLGVSLDYNVASDYDKVLVLSGIASEIEELAPHANEIATLVANLPDVLTVQEASELVNNLTVKVTTLPAGSTATSELVGTEIRLGIPAGTQGAQGIQGPKGDKGDKGDIGLTGAKGPAGATGSQGLRGFRGEDGLDGEGVAITSVLNNINKSLTINFSDGTQHTTDPLKGEDGRSVTITNVVNNANGTMLINFSDGTSHHTADLRGPRGFKGDTGDHVHHISYQRSKDPLGNEVGPTEPGRPGYNDSYAMWASQEELPETYIGEFTAHNGLNTLTAEEQVKFDSIEFGATADQEAFEVLYDNTISGLLSEDVQNSIDELSATKLNLIEKGQPNGVASLDSNGAVPSTQLPSYVDDVLEYATYAELPVTGEAGKIYIVVADETSGDDTSSYRWTGTVYAMVSNTLTASDVKALYEANPDTNEYSDAEKVLVDVGQVLETTATTLPTAINELVSVKVDKIVGSSLVPDTKVSLYDLHIIDTANPHVVTKAQVGLSNAEDTKDNVKNVLSATKWTTARTITLSGDVTGSVSVDGSANVTMSTIIQPNSVALGTDTTGNYMVGIIAGSGLSVSHTQGEGSTATITNSAPNVTTNITTTHNSTNVVVNSSDGTDGTINSATQTLAGVISAADKTKLDGIEVGATGDQTANEILTLLNTVDGSGSGLDADLLDGQEGAYYLNASNINAGTIDDTRLPATITSSTIGNSATATKLATARTINGVSFDGTANITVADSTAVKLTGDQTVAGVKTFSSNPISTATQSTATNALTRKDYVDTKAPIASPTFTGTVTLPATTSIGNVSSTELEYLDGATSNIQTQLAGKLGTTATAAAATKLATARTIALGGDVTGSVNFDGSGNASITTTVADDSHNHIISNVDGLQAALDLKADQATTYTKEETESYVQQKLSDGGNGVYIGSYGLEWNETTDTYRRIGAANYTAIQSMMRRCVLNSDGGINYYLDKNNSNFKEDGTLAKLDETDGNVMVQVPKTYVRYEYTTIGGAGTDIVHRWEISLEPETGFEAHWAFNRGVAISDKRYYPAYLGYVTGGKMISRSGVYPTVNQTLVQFRAAAKANSISNPSSGQTANGYWGNIDFALYELITLLAVIEYGTMNIQSALGRGRTALSGGSLVGGELIGVNGLSNEYGNRTVNYTYVGASTDANADLSFMSYRGCENFFGNVWRMADGVIFKGTTNNKTMWYSTTPTGYNETGAGYVNSGIVTAAVTGYGRKLANTNKGFIISDVTGGNSNAGTTDYYYTSTTDNTVALVGGSSADGLNAGPLSLHVYYSAASLSSANVGCGVSF